MSDLPADPVGRAIDKTIEESFGAAKQLLSKLGGDAVGQIGGGLGDQFDTGGS